MPLSAAQMVLFLVVCSIPVRNAGGRRNEMIFEAKLGQGRSLFLQRDVNVCLHLLAACLLRIGLSMISVTTYVSGLSNFVSRLADTCIQAEKLGYSTPRIHASTYFCNHLFATG